VIESVSEWETASMSYNDDVSIASDDFTQEALTHHSGDECSVEQETDVNDDNSIENKSFLDLEYISDEVQFV